MCIYNLYLYIYIYYVNILIYNMYNILACGSKGTFQIFLSIFFLFRIHYSICDFQFLFSHCNSIYDAGLNISGWYLKAFLAWLNTMPKILFPLWCIIYINIYSTIHYRWPDVDGWYIEECSAVIVMWTSPDKLHEVMQLLQFEDIVERALTFEKGSDVELRVNYLKDVSLLLSLVSAVRECNI